MKISMIRVADCMIDNSGVYNKRIERNEALFENLKNNIKLVGLITPITVYKDDDKYIIVDGRHRFEAFCAVYPSVADIKATVITDDKQAILVGLTANFLRKEYHSADKAVAFMELLADAKKVDPEIQDNGRGKELP